MKKDTLKGTGPRMASPQKEAQVIVRMSDAEQRLLVAVAGRASLDLESWMRHTCIEAARAYAELRATAKGTGAKA
jgi:hypothetical protein